MESQWCAFLLYRVCLDFLMPSKPILWLYLRQNTTTSFQVLAVNDCTVSRSPNLVNRLLALHIWKSQFQFSALKLAIVTVVVLQSVQVNNVLMCEI